MLKASIRALRAGLGAGPAESTLLRLFVLPPAQAQPWPRWLSQLGLRGLRAVATQLGVTRIGRVDDWLLRLLLLPASDPRTRTWSPPWLRRGLSALGWLLSLPVRILNRQLDRFDFRDASRRLEAGADLVAAWPLPLRALLVLVAGGLFWMAVSTPLGQLQQFLFFMLIWVLALVVRRLPGNLTTLMLVALSLMATGRYVWWRMTHTLEFEGVAEHLLGWGLVLAEAYTWLIMLLGYVQNAWPLQRKPIPLPEDRSLWPTVDVFVPSYNEPLKVVKPTLYAALGMDWPRDKLRVWLLDDGRRAEFRDFCASIGCGYLTRDDNAHAKAGNVNRALKKTSAEYIAIFDCDHVPVRSFLRNTLGWFLKDPKCALLQTPHHFFSPDPFERNLGTFRRVPNEGSLFYGLVQDGNDLWNATFFCGSCAVIRRKPLEEVGGIAVETVTEDAHTALRLHRRGYNTAYLNLIQAAGLATESLSGHVGQRIRWARGMAQIFRTDNPIFGRGLDLLQRLCYSNAMLHFFHGIPRLVFLTAPLAYLYFGWHVIYAAASAIMVYALPHLFLAGVANTRMQGRYRHSYWAEVYEAVLAWYITLPTTIAFINPKLGKFNVTAKGGLIEKDYFDFHIARPYLILTLLNFLGVLAGFGRLLFDDAADRGTVVMNVAWALYNLIMLGTAIGVATETKQVRKSHRVPVRIPARVRLTSGRELEAESEDFSLGGLGMRLQQPLDIAPGTPVEVLLEDEHGVYAFPAEVTQTRGQQLGTRFRALDTAQEAQLVLCTFGRPEVWRHWHRESVPDRPFDSLREVLTFGLRGYARLGDRIAANLERRLRTAPAAT